METLPVITDEFKEKVKAFKEEWHAKYKGISNLETPQVDGNGNKIVDKRPDGLDYIIDAYMTDCLDKHFPGWSWRRAGGLQFLGSEWVVADGELFILDEMLTLYGIQPPYRVFWGCGAARIQYKRELEHIPKNIVDIDKNVKAANTNAKKVAINRLTRIGDDIYGKRVEEEGAGSLEDIIMATGDATIFGQWVQSKKISWSEVFKILEVSSLTEITDYKKAMEDIKLAKGLK